MYRSDEVEQQNTEKAKNQLNTVYYNSMNEHNYFTVNKSTAKDVTTKAVVRPFISACDNFLLPQKSDLYVDIYNRKMFSCINTILFY